ncbi:MAG: hypothetical protein MRZ79_02695 [Bacteroidia bacterium]|nr:hypothetical protein [Bacteroidia bacterium]
MKSLKDFSNSDQQLSTTQLRNVYGGKKISTAGPHGKKDVMKVDRYGELVWIKVYF